MSLVNEESLERAKLLRKNAIQDSSYESSYQKALRGLELAIALLEQVNATTKGIKIETTISLVKE